MATDEDEVLLPLHQDTSKTTSHLDTNWIQTWSYCGLVLPLPEIRVSRWKTVTLLVIRTPAEYTCSWAGH